ncbi:hypothetical protein [Frisingicoccus sp.]|uniref:hypothetical protein n=1 Tax=Frisingicoccus sp. TaxID=1918627 RepID=UPI003AB6C927
MKNLSVLKNFSIIILSLSAFSAKAETVYWVGDGTLSDSNTSAWDSTGSWSSGTVPNETSDIIFDKDYLTGYAGAYLGSNLYIKINSLKIDSNYGYFQVRQGSNSVFEIAGDFIKENTSETLFCYTSNNPSSAPTLTIGGNLQVGTADYVGTGASILTIGADRDSSVSGWGGPKTLTINGNIDLYNTCQLKLNVGTTTTTYDTYDPAVYIGGVINMHRGTGEMAGKNPTLYLINRSDKAPAGTTTVISCNGVSGEGVITTSIGSEAVASTPILHLRNSEDQNFSGWLSGSQYASSKIIMEGTATQTFSGSKIAWTGGIEVRSGTLIITGRAPTDSNVNHGDLDMLGGQFGILAGSVSTQGVFWMNNLNYTSGDILLNVNTSTSDMIKLDGTIIDKGFSDGVNFILSGNLDLLVDNFVKIVEWGSISEIADSDYHANKYGDLNAVFDSRDDGLYVMYAAVPEPATFAAFFGTIALAIAALRKRN